MNREIQFFNYEQCYMHYVQEISHIKQAKKQGDTILAKPVLLVALIDGIEQNVFKSNLFTINNWLEEHYKMLMEQYVKDSQFDKKTSIDKPFWHLESDGFWHLNYQGERPNKNHTPSKAWLKSNVAFAYFDESLWILLQSKSWRIRLRSYIIEQKL